MLGLRSPKASDIAETLGSRYGLPVLQASLEEGEANSAPERAAVLLGIGAGVVSNFLPGGQSPPALQDRPRKAAQSIAKKYALTERGQDAALLAAYGLLRWQIEFTQALEYVGSKREWLAGWAPFWAAHYNELLDIAPLSQADLDLLDKPSRVYTVVREDGSLLEEADSHPLIDRTLDRGVMDISDEDFVTLMGLARECSLIETDKLVFEKIAGPEYEAVSASLFAPTVSLDSSPGEISERNAWVVGNHAIKSQYVERVIRRCGGERPVPQDLEGWVEQDGGSA